ncbi:50S ribosomal protein L33 [TM7 phylum sp. oral taxon 348]|nr:50S ribosomal protein L33 [TM7 phylum sp. oral taxon 348]
MAKKKNTKRKLIGLVSNLSGHRTYYTTVNTQNRTTKGQSKLTLRKYDPVARQHATYTETKKNLGRNEVKPRKG